MPTRIFARFAMFVSISLQAQEDNTAVIPAAANNTNNVLTEFFIMSYYNTNTATIQP